MYFINEGSRGAYVLVCAFCSAEHDTAPHAPHWQIHSYLDNGLG
jgi:hypothetical protein